MLDRWTAVKQDITLIASDGMMEHKEELIGLVVEQQYTEHVDSNGDPLREYSPAYRAHKELSGASGETDLRETGAFQENMNLRVEDGVYEFESPATTDKGELKSQWLKDWNGADIMGLTPDNKIEAWKIMRPTVVDIIAEKTECEAA